MGLSEYASLVLELSVEAWTSMLSSSMKHITLFSGQASLFPRLERLDWKSSKPNYDTIYFIAPTLQYITIESTESVTSYILDHISQRCTELRQLAAGVSITSDGAAIQQAN
jgi:hypothetical protein